MVSMWVIYGYPIYIYSITYIPIMVSSTPLGTPGGPMNGGILFVDLASNEWNMLV